MVSLWKQAPENTLESLRHAILHNDGIEFDIRMTSDGELIIHHDSKISVPPKNRPCSFSWVENHTLDDLTNFGFLSLRSLLEDTTVRTQWKENGKMGCLEFKRPHPRALYGGGIFGKRQHISHIGAMMSKAETLLDEYEIPHQNTVYYAFHTGMKSSVQNSNIQRPWANLTPYIPPFGTYYTKRMRGAIQFLTTPVSRLVRSNKNSGASMAPCAVEYFVPPKNFIPIGRRGGLHGARAANVNAIQQGYPIYVWPAELKKEHHILSAGLTGLTDCSDPEMTWLPSGHLRWTQPATLPLDSVQTQTLTSAQEQNHLEIRKELLNEVTPWIECDLSRQKELIQFWRKRWQWKSSVEEILEHCNSTSPPWEAIRLIGHRGSGKTSRPVLDGNHST